MDYEKVKGCLVGAAVGDALGFPFCNMSPEELEMEWGVVTEMESTFRGEKGAGGDYTQLMLITLKSIVATGKFDPEDIAQRLIKWIPVAKSHSNATYRSAQKLRDGVSWRESALDFPTSGPVCRNLPYAILYLNESFNKTESICITSSNITHQNLSSVAASNIYSFMVRGLIKGELDPKNVGEFLREIGDYATLHDDELGNIILNLENLIDLDTMEGLRYISTTADITEVFPSAIYCFLKSPEDFERSLVEAVNAGFATDAHCFLVGGLSGAYNGLSSIPERWLSKTKAAAQIIELVELLPL